MKIVIEMAKEAGLLTIGTADGSEAVYTWPKGITEEIERFAELVRADEREQIIDLVAMYGGPVDLEAAIRARSNT